MKKQMKWLLAALAIAALATPAFAVTADMTGTLAVRGIAVNNFDGNDDAHDYGKWADQRLRLFTSVAANENVKAVLGIEVDNVFGRVAGAGAATTYTVVGQVPSTTAGTITIPGAAAGKEVGTMGTDAKGQFELKHLYLDFKIPSLGANVKAGSQPFNFGRGLIINDDAAGVLVTLPCQVNKDNVIQLSWIKTSEGSSEVSRDDGDFYGIKYSAKVAGVGIAPYAGYYTSLNGAKSSADIEAGFFGVDIDGKAAGLGYALTAIYNNWSKDSTGADGSSVALYGKGTYAVGDTSLSLEAGLMGDDENGGNAMNLQQGTATGPIQNISEILTGGMYTANAGPDTNVGAAGGAGNLYLTNWKYIKVGAVQKLSDSMKVSAYVAHIEQAEDTSTNAITYGQEVDAYFDYTIVPGLGLNVMGAYLFADNDFGAGDNAYKLGTSLNYKF